MAKIDDQGFWHEVHQRAVSLEDHSSINIRLLFALRNVDDFVAANAHDFNKGQQDLALGHKRFNINRLGSTKVHRFQQCLESGSGPGGRRFKSSLPDQSFLALKHHFWFSVYIDGVDFVDGHVFLDFPLGFHRELQSDLPARTLPSAPSRTSTRGQCPCPRAFFTTDGPSVVRT